MMSISDAFEIKQTAKIREEDLNGHILKVKSKSREKSLLSRTREVRCHFLTKQRTPNTANRQNCYLQNNSAGKQSTQLSMLLGKGYHSERRTNSSNRIRRVDYSVSPIHCGGRQESKHS